MPQDLQQKIEEIAQAVDKVPNKLNEAIRQICQKLQVPTKRTLPPSGRAKS